MPTKKINETQFREYSHHKFCQILSLKNKISARDKALQMKLFFIFADSMGD
jgi:hypothetical protein